MPNLEDIANLFAIVNEKTEALNRARAALGIIQKYNHLRNDLDGYLYGVVEWGLGEIPEQPKPESFGLKP